MRGGNELCDWQHLKQARHSAFGGVGHAGVPEDPQGGGPDPMVQQNTSANRVALSSTHQHIQCVLF